MCVAVCVCVCVCVCGNNSISEGFDCNADLSTYSHKYARARIPSNALCGAHDNSISNLHTCVVRQVTTRGLVLDEVARPAREHKMRAHQPNSGSSIVRQIMIHKCCC